MKVRLAWLAALVLALAAEAAGAADKSSARPNVIAVPSGPGSLTGLGESFEASLHSGSVRESLPLEVPPGTGGLSPSLALTYDSGFGNGPLGLGWSLGVSTIQVQTEKGVPRYDGTDRYLLDGAELVPVGGGVYRLALEGRFARARQAGGRWEVDLPDGKTLRYGVSADARVTSTDGGQVFSWALEEVVDRSGNRIGYFYAKDRGQLYLQSIQYNRRAGAADALVTFDYEPRPDVATDCRARFCVSTARRLRLVSMYARGQLARRYRLDYLAAGSIGGAVASANGVSLLRAVTQVGSDDRTALPPVTFSYSAFAASGTAYAMQSVPAFTPGPGSGDDELVDIDGDGFPDLLHAEAGAHWYALNQGGLRFGPRVDMPWSPSFALSASGVEVADLDGDGLPDLVAKSGSDFRYFPNLGQGQWEASKPFTHGPPFGLEDPNVRMLDFDGDKLTDVVQLTSSGFTLWRNRGDGGWDGPFAAPPPPGATALSFSDPHLKLADMNGDRLLDLVYVRTGSVTYWPNLGWGQFGDPVEVANAPDPGAQAESSFFLGDLNGDGLADLLWVDTDHVEVWPLLPSGAYGDRIVVRGTPYYDPASTVIRLADMDGNGSVDVVWSTPTAPPEQRLQVLDLVGDLRPNLLVTVANGMGKTLTVKYTSSGREYQEARDGGQPCATRVPFPVQVLAESSLADGRGHVEVTGYAYRDGWYAPDTREFRGFAQVVQTDLGDAFEATARTVHAFDVGRVDEALKGVPLALETRTAAGALLRRETYAYTLHPYGTGTDGEPVRGADRTRHEVEHWEGGSAPVITREEWSYDDYGDVLVHSEWGIVDGANTLAGNDERITTSAYANDTTSWLLQRPVRVTVTDAAGTVFSDERIYYDGDAFVGLPYGQLGAAGAKTRREGWVAGDHWAQLERVQRDAYGLVTATLDPLGARREVDYDAETHCYPVAERAPYEGGRVLTFAAAYDLAQGTLQRSTDPAGRQTLFGWDALHRLTAVAKPGDTLAAPTLAVQYVAGDPLSYVATQARVTVGGADVVERRLWYDGLGRRLGEVAQAEGGRTLVRGERDFGLQGRVIREYQPFFSDGYDLPAAASPFTEHHYDALGRRVRTVLPDGSPSEQRFAPLAVEQWDAEDLDPASPHAGTPRTVRRSALGVTQVEERLGTRTLVTRFDRDPLGHIARVTDAVGSAASWTRDGLGRMVEADDPDAGVTTFDLDDAGRLHHRVDARGAVVAVDYDALGRPLVEQLSDAHGTPEEKVSYHYDDPSPLFPGDAAVGELAWVEDGAGEEHLRRDERGRIVERVRKVDGKSYRVQRAFDDLDRTTREIHPDGQQLDFRYGPRGLLESVPGVIDAVAYDARGLFTRREHANGTVTTASYDDLARVSALATARGGAQLQSLTYGYDRAGNLLRIADAVHADGARSATRQNAFDDLYRLVSAQGAGRAWSYAYDDVGDFTEKSDVGAYLYAQGHRVASAGGKSFRYDEAGNTVERPGARLTYDAKGRLRTVTLDDGTAVAYRYDYTGRRVVKESHGPRGDHKTVYVDESSEERDGQAIDYVLDGSTRLARLGGPQPRPLAAGALARTPPTLLAAALALFTAGLLLALARMKLPARSAAALGSACSLLAAALLSCGHGPGTQVLAATHYHADHLGGTALLTDQQGQIAAEIAYDPWGVELAGASEPYAFTGKEYEPDTGLYDYAARAYDPVLARFVSPDSLVLFEPERSTGEVQEGGSDHDPGQGPWSEIVTSTSADSDQGDVANPASLNRYSYVWNNPYKYTDPTGHDTYRQNRDIGQAKVTSNSDPLSHTFTFTTNPDGTVAHTYSWGNSANTHGWNKDQPEDLKAAADAVQRAAAARTQSQAGGLHGLEGKLAAAKDALNRVGDASLDWYVEKAFNEMNKKENEHANWGVARNCKAEATKLQKRAEAMRAQAAETRGTTKSQGTVSEEKQ